jgi:hypothetical protein
MQEIFTKGMNKWFVLKEFQVGVPTEDVDQSSSFEDFLTRVDKVGLLSTTVGRALGSLPHGHRVGGFAAKTGKLGGVAGRIGKVGDAAGRIGKAGGAAGTIVLLSDFLIDTKTSAADLYDALKPYVSRADLIGLKISNAKAWNTFREPPGNKTFWNTVLVPVIYADELASEAVLQWFDKFLRASAALKRLGLRVKLVGSRAHIYPLLVYFDSQRFEEHRQALWPEIFEEDDTEGVRPRYLSKRASWTPEFKAYLSAEMVNVPGKQVISEIFDEDDLYSVLEWGQSESSSPSLSYKRLL